MDLPLLALPVLLYNGAVLLAVLALIVVKALAHSPWGTFTVMATVPVALFMGFYVRYLRPGHIGEVSVIGAEPMIVAHACTPV